MVDLEMPSLAPGQLRVEVAYSGVCHSQLLEARGRRGPDRFLPHAMGHEGAGVVREVGAGVSKVKVGDPVVLSWIKGSGADVPSTRYDSSIGPVNSGAICTFMRQTITCESRVVAVPAALPLRQAALLGCAIPTGAGIVFNMMAVDANSSIAVFGVGGIGLSALMAARARGARCIIAIDVVDRKLDEARALGAHHAIDASSTDVLSTIMSLTDGRGVDFCIEAAGRTATMEIAFESVRAGGGLCVVAGNLPHGQRISLDPMDLIRGKQLQGTWGGQTQPDRDIPRYAQLSVDGLLPLERLISHEYSLGHINLALADLESGKVNRALVDMARID